MPHELKVFFPSTWVGQPPGMTWDDWQPWKIYLLTGDAKRHEFAYDIELRIDQAPASVTDPALREMWARVNARRIDAVGRAGDEITLYEARRHAGWSALAQLRGYTALWPMFHADKPVARLVLVVETIPDEIRAVAHNDGLQVFVSTEDPGLWP